MSDRKLQNTLKVHRARFGWTQAELSERVGVPRKTITAIETGRFMPSTWLALRLADALTARVEDLFQLDKPEQDTQEDLPWYLQGP